MEWVETTGRTLEEAKDAALDELGVDEADAEFEVVEEAKSGLFGRVRSEARVRARVRPTAPPPKGDRRGSRKRTGERGGAPAAGADEETTPRPAPAPVITASASVGREEVRAERDEPIDLEAAGDEASSFVEGLVGAFGAEGATNVEDIDDETLEVRVQGDDLGLLIGPRGATLQAVQELTRTVVHRNLGGGARVRVDIGGYHERRRAALERFTRDVAGRVLSSGTAAALEPMNAADRKVVHDTANAIDGVETSSEGVEPQRRVVLAPVG